MLGLGYGDASGCRRALNIILKARHEIAHSGTTEEKLSYEKNYEYMETLVGIAQFTEDAMNKQLKIE